MEQNELGTKRIPPLVMKMAFPLIIAQLVNGLYNIVDRIYLGHLEGAGAEILTGVGITYPVILLISPARPVFEQSARLSDSIFLNRPALASLANRAAALAEKYCAVTETASPVKASANSSAVMRMM